MSDGGVAGAEPLLKGVAEDAKRLETGGTTVPLHPIPIGKLNATNEDRKRRSRRTTSTAEHQKRIKTTPGTGSELKLVSELLEAPKSASPTVEAMRPTTRKLQKATAEPQNWS